MRRSIHVLAGAGVLAAALIGTGITARSLWAGGDEVEPRGGHDGHGFSERSIKGYWGFNTEVGYIMPPITPLPTLTAGIGRIYFDGDGGCSVSNVANIAGERQSFSSSTCSYSVEPDGTGTAEAVFPDSPIKDPLPVAFIIVDRGREIRFANTKFLVGAFTAHRQ